MPTLANVPRKETDKIIQAALTPEEYNEFKAVAQKKDWSDKKLNEKIVRLFLKEAKKNPKKLEEL